MTMKTKFNLVVLALMALVLAAFDVLMVGIGILTSFDFMYGAENVLDYLLIQVWTAGYFGTLSYSNYKLLKRCGIIGKI